MTHWGRSLPQDGEDVYTGRDYSVDANGIPLLDEDDPEWTPRHTCTVGDEYFPEYCQHPEHREGRDG